MVPRLKTVGRKTIECNDSLFLSVQKQRTRPRPCHPPQMGGLRAHKMPRRAKIYSEDWRNADDHPTLVRQASYAGTVLIGYNAAPIRFQFFAP